MANVKWREIETEKEKDVKDLSGPSGALTLGERSNRSVSEGDFMRLTSGLPACRPTYPAREPVDLGKVRVLELTGR